MATQPYSESDDHVPNPLYQSAVVDTTGTSGDLGSRIENTSPVFAQAKADAFANAVDAVDDPARNEDEVVVFHEGEDGQPTREEGIETLRKAAEDAAANPQLQDPGQTPAAAEAAKEGEDKDGKNDGSGDSGGADDGSSGGDGDGLPADTDSKAKWTEFAQANDLDVDKSLLKDDYVAAVKKAHKKKASE